MQTTLYQKFIFWLLPAGVLGILFSNAVSATENPGEDTRQKSFRNITAGNLDRLQQLHNEAEELIVLDKIRPAIQKYMEIILMEPDDETAYANMGHCYLILGDTGRAKDAFQNALDINPENEVALEGLQRIQDPDKPMETPSTEAQIPNTPETNTPMAPTLSSLDLLSQEQKIQVALKNAGLYTGRIDGILGPASVRAIMSFQNYHGLEIDGKVGPKTWAALEPYLHTENQKKD